MKLKEIKEGEKGQFLNRYNLIYQTKTGKEKVYEIVCKNKTLKEENLSNQDKSDSVLIIAFNKDMTKICLNREFRLSVNRVIYNLPAGFIEENETVSESGTRELAEETGLKVSKILHTLTGSYSCIGISNERTATFFCCAEGDPRDMQDDEEEIEPFWCDKETAKRIAETGNCTARTQLFLYLFGNDFLKI